MDLPTGVLTEADFDSLVTAMRGGARGPVDVSHLDEWFMGEGSGLSDIAPILGDEGIAQLKRVFVEHLTRDIARLREAAVSGDLSALRYAALTAKSGAVGVGADQMAELARILERAAGRELPPKPWNFLTSATAQLIGMMLDFQAKYGTT